MKTRIEARDLRSLERRSMYSIFAPLDPNERLPRELLDQRADPRGLSLLAREHRPLRRREIAAAIFFPALFLAFAAGFLGKLDATTTFGAAGLFVVGLGLFAVTDKR